MTPLLVLLSVFAAGLPMVAYLVVMVLLDRYEREPWWLVGATFAWGAVGAVGLSMAGSLLIGLPVEALLGPDAARVAGTVLIAPLVEEPAKALILLLVANTRWFDNATDGFVYGAAAGLGFGMSENLLYFGVVATSGAATTWAAVVVVRTLFTAMMHACASSMVGAALGYARYRSWGVRAIALPVGLALAVGMHALWNGPLAIEQVIDTDGVVGVLAYLVFPVEFVALFAIYQLCLWGERRVILRELAMEAADGTLPAEHATHIASWISRLRPRSWLPEEVEPRSYIRSATLLAFRRHQLRLAGSSGFCEEEIVRLRAEVLRALGG